MKVDQIIDYEQQIFMASKGKLLLITYDLMLDSLKNARRSLERQELEGFKASMDKGQQYLSYLMETLDMSYDLSKELLSLYFYVNKQLVLSKISRKIKHLMDAITILEALQEGFAEVVDSQDDHRPIIENAHNVLQNIIYGRNGQLV